jgi:acetoin utilization deacetylase AcuC-like enzyme
MLCVYFNESFNMNEDHPENHKRIITSVKHLKYTFKNKLKIYNSTQINQYLIKHQGVENIEELAKDFLKNSYNLEYLDNIKNKCNDLHLDDIIEGDTYFSRLTYNEIIDSATIMYNICNQIAKNNIKYAYALIRPPSHHSQLNLYSGFCFVNQTYQTAKYLHDKHNKKVFILDYDVHHGDGTQALVNKNFEDDIYFCSIHCYSLGFYPGTGDENENNTKVLNIPLPKKTTNETYIEKFNEKVKPFINKTNPDIIIISNGVDAHKNDPMKVMNVTNEFYIYVSKYLKSLEKPLIYILEGGYSPIVIANVSEDIINVLINN